MRFAGDALNHDNYGQQMVDGQQRLVEPAHPNKYPQVLDTPAHLTGQGAMVLMSNPAAVKSGSRFSVPLSAGAHHRPCAGG